MRRSSAIIYLAFILMFFTAPVNAQSPNTAPVGSSPLVRLLQSKGILTEQEAASISEASSPTDSELRLLKLLLSKGLITQSEYAGMTSSMAASAAPAPQSMVASLSHEVVGIARAARESFEPVAAAAQAKAAAVPSPVIPAFAPLRVLGLAGDPAYKRDGLVPVFKIGNDIKVKPYGIFKASMISDSSSPGGNDIPLPGFLGDTGPGNSPEFHINARSFRVGADFEWLDPSKDITITGRVEADFEGNFSRVNNRSISSIRSPAFQMRLAWMRIDKKFSDKTSAFALFGQDWTAFGSSTLPSLIETTGLGLGYGTLYERAPQFRFGVGRELGGKRKWRFEPEFAFVLPVYGNTPSDVSNQLAFGERQGADSNTPEIQGRFVTQFQLDTAPAVPAAQLIASWTYGQRSAIVTAANVPTAFKVAFPHGAQVDSSRYGYSLEAQLPTRWFTLQMKGFTGADLRFYFVGDLFSNFNDTFGLKNTSTVASIDGSSNVVFGFDAQGNPVVAPQRPVRAVGGFIDLGLPLSRLFSADPKGRNAAWTFNMHYSFDEANPWDVRQINPANRSRDDLFAGTLNYKFNKYFNVAFEESYYRTRAASHGGPLPLFRGIPSYQWHDVRQQMAFYTTF